MMLRVVRSACLLLLGAAATSASVEAQTYNFTNVADLSSMAPNGNFQAFDYVRIGDGVVVFNARFGTGPYDTGIFTGNGGALTTIAKVGDSTSVGTITSVEETPDIDDGIAAFIAVTTGGTGIFTGNGGTLSTIVVTGDAAPGPYLSERYFSDFNAPMYSNGVVAFIGGIVQTAPSFGVTGGNYVSSGGGAARIVERFQPGPLGLFDYAIGRPDIDGDAVVFQATNSGNSGVFLHNGSGFSTIVQSGDAAPVGTFDAFASDVNIGDGYVAFMGYYNGSIYNQGVFRSHGNVLDTIALTSDLAPSGSPFYVFQDVETAGGYVAFEAATTGGDQGVYVGNGSHVFSVLEVGDALFGSTVSNVSLGGIDSQGNVAFLYDLSDGNRGVGVAHLTAVPEPGSMILCGLAAGGASWRAWRRKRRTPVVDSTTSVTSK